MADRKKNNLYDDEGIWPAESQATERASKDMCGSEDNSGEFESEDEHSGRKFSKVKNNQDSDDDDHVKERRSNNVEKFRDRDRNRERYHNRDWEREQDSGNRDRDWEGYRPRPYWGKPRGHMERGRYREMGRGRGRWNSDRGGADYGRGRFRGGPHWGNHGGRDRRFRGSPGRRSRSHSPARKRMRSRSSSRSRSRSRSDSPRKRRNYSRSVSPSRNRGRNASLSRSKSPPNRQHVSGSGYVPQVQQSASYSSFNEDPFRGPQPPGVDSPVIRQQYAAPPFPHTGVPPPGIPPPTQAHPPGPPPGYPGYENYFQHQPPPSLYPPGVPDYIAPAAWSAPEYPPPSSAHVSDAKQQNSSSISGGPGSVPVPQPSHDSSNLSVPPPTGAADDSNKKEAIERELRTQKQNLVTQREEYFRKSKVFERELGLLRAQQEELSAESSRDNERILQENHKLQVEIQNKLKAINNVIDMLTGIIGDDKAVAQKMMEADGEKGTRKGRQEVRSRSRSTGKARSQSASSSDSSSDDVQKSEKPDSTSPEEDFQKYNYVHFDPENHWCRVCNVFPRTAKEYLHHLHSMEHKDQITVRKLVDMPWHKDHPAEEVPQLPGAPTKRTPIKGLQFFISAPAWYCKLCAVWMGDLHCASIHLKSKLHAVKYHSFIKENAGWESNWLSDREQAYERLAEVKSEDKKADGYQASKEKKADAADHAGKERLSRQDRVDKSDKAKKRTRSSSQSSSGSAERNQDIETTGGWVKDRSRTDNNASRMRGKERPREKDQARSRGRDKDSQEQESETDKSKSIRVAMRNKESRLSNEKNFEPVEPNTASTASVSLKSKWDSPDRKNGASSPARPAGRNVSAPVDDRMMREWLPVEESENQLLSNLKNRVKRKNEDSHKEKENEKEPKSDKDRARKDKNFYTEPQYGRNKFSRDVTPPRSRRSRGNEDSSRWDASGNPGALRESPPPHRRINEGKGRDRDRDRERGERGDRERERDRDRDRERDRERERDRDRDRERERERDREPRHPPGPREEEDDESSFDRKANRKQQPVMTIKSKLPFIGRMPVFKNFPKKGDEKSKSDENSSPPHGGSASRMSPSPDLTGKPASPIILGATGAVSLPEAVLPRGPAPVPSAAQINASIMEYRAKLLDGTALTVESPNSTASSATVSASPMPKSTLILSKTPAVSIDNLMKNNKDSDMKQALKKLSEQMQLMEKVQSTPLPTTDEPVPMELEEEAETGPGLSKDFQDALEIIFPDNTKPADAKTDGDVAGLPDVKNPPPNLIAGLPNLSNPPPGILPATAPPTMGVDGMYPSNLNMEGTSSMIGAMPPPPVSMGIDANSQNASQSTISGPPMGMGMEGNMQAPMGMGMYDGPPGTYPDMQGQRMYPPGPMGPMGPMGMPPMGGPRMGCPPMGPMGPPPMGMPMGPPPMGMPMGPPPMGVPPMAGPRPPTTPTKSSSKLDMSADDMAMLGIDADDIGAQGM